MKVCMVKKVKCTVVQALRLCIGRMAHRESSGIALLFLDHGTRRVSRSLLPAKAPYPLYRKLGRPQGRSRQVPKILPPTGIQSPDRPTRSQSLYRLSYPAYKVHMIMFQILSGESTAVWIYKYKRIVNGNKEREYGYCYFVLTLNLTFEWQVYCTEMTNLLEFTANV